MKAVHGESPEGGIDVEAGAELPDLDEVVADRLVEEVLRAGLARLLRRVPDHAQPDHNRHHQQQHRQVRVGAAPAHKQQANIIKYEIRHK